MDARRLEAPHNGGLGDAEVRYRSLVELLPVVTYVAYFGEAGQWLYASPQIEAMLGFPATDWTADPSLWYRRIHPEDKARVMRAEARSERARVPLDCEYRLVAADGHQVWVRDQAVLVRADDDRLLFQGILSDVSERRHAQDTLRRAYEREHEAAAQLRSLDEMKNALLHAVSHELRTPLASILGYALSLLREDLGLGDGERREMLQRMALNARKMDRLLGDLLDLDRLERGLMEPRRELVDVGAMAHRVVAEADLEGRAVTVDAPPAVAAVDGPKVERILENLVLNALRHTPAWASISVRVRRTAEGTELSVEDDGPGVPDELKPVVFDPYQRGATVVGGSGIGLSLVSRFTALHGGRAWVEDRPGGGAVFRVLLPNALADEGSPPAAS